MNVPFVTGDKDLDALFVKEAEKAGFVNLKGHRTVGGMRASIYNAMPEEGVVKLVEFMKNLRRSTRTRKAAGSKRLQERHYEKDFVV